MNSRVLRLQSLQQSYCPILTGIPRFSLRCPYALRDFLTIRRDHCTPRNPSAEAITTTPTGKPASRYVCAKSGCRPVAIMYTSIAMIARNVVAKNAAMPAATPINSD